MEFESSQEWLLAGTKVSQVEHWDGLVKSWCVIHSGIILCFSGLAQGIQDSCFFWCPLRGTF